MLARVSYNRPVITDVHTGSLIDLAGWRTRHPWQVDQAREKARRRLRRARARGEACQLLLGPGSASRCPGTGATVPLMGPTHRAYCPGCRRAFLTEPRTPLGTLCRVPEHEKQPERNKIRRQGIDGGDFLPRTRSKEPLT